MTEDMEPLTPLNPELAKKIMHKIRESNGGQLPGSLEERHIDALLDDGINLKKLADVGILLVHKSGIIKPDEIRGLAYEDSMLNQEPMEDMPDGWYGQGGVEVHKQDNDMLRAKRHNAVNPDLKVSVRIRGVTNEEQGLKTFNELIRYNQIRPDYERLELAIDKFRVSLRSV
ncbi:MAG: hypothetical protein ACKVOE_10725 [Rickettsiales bacterium]